MLSVKRKENDIRISGCVMPVRFCTITNRSIFLCCQNLTKILQLEKFIEKQTNSVQSQEWKAVKHGQQFHKKDTNSVQSQQ